MQRPRQNIAAFGFTRFAWKNPFIGRGFRGNGIAVEGDDIVKASYPAANKVNDEAVWHEEFLSARVALRVVSDLYEAIELINRYSGGHSAAIVTRDEETARAFMEKVDCAAVYHNASVRFTDGGEFGLGAEIAISTQKLHFRGPLGSQTFGNEQMVCIRHRPGPGMR